jgi:hypothetical protein
MQLISLSFSFSMAVCYFCAGKPRSRGSAVHCSHCWVQHRLLHLLFDTANGCTVFCSMHLYHLVLAKTVSGASCSFTPDSISTAVLYVLLQASLVRMARCSQLYIVTVLLQHKQLVSRVRLSGAAAWVGLHVTSCVCCQYLLAVCSSSWSTIMLSTAWSPRIAHCDCASSSMSSNSSADMVICIAKAFQLRFAGATV